MRIHTLIEDIPVEGYKTEHGLSIFIETSNGNYLLDAGTTDAFLNNACKMGLNVGAVKCSILSHGHYDHSGGYATYLEQNPSINVYAAKGADGVYYSGTGGRIHEVGIPKNVLPSYGKHFIYVDKATEIAENVWVIPHTTKGLEIFAERATLYKKSGDGYVPDDFLHEQSLVFDTPEGLVIFNSCSHGGIRIIIEEAKSVFPGKKVHAFVGGLHMKGKVDGKEICIFTEEEVKEMTDYLSKEGVDKLYTGHCTGMIAFGMLQEHLGKRLVKLTTGESQEIS